MTKFREDYPEAAKKLEDLDVQLALLASGYAALYLAAEKKASTEKGGDCPALSTDQPERRASVARGASTDPAFYKPSTDGCTHTFSKGAHLEVDAQLGISRAICKCGETVVISTPPLGFERVKPAPEPKPAEPGESVVAYLEEALRGLTPGDSEGCVRHAIRVYRAERERDERMRERLEALGKEWQERIHELRNMSFRTHGGVTDIRASEIAMCAGELRDILSEKP